MPPAGREPAVTKSGNTQSQLEIRRRTQPDVAAFAFAFTASM